MKWVMTEVNGLYMRMQPTVRVSVKIAIFEHHVHCQVNTEMTCYFSRPSRQQASLKKPDILVFADLVGNGVDSLEADTVYFHRRVILIDAVGEPLRSEGNHKIPIL